MIPTRQSISRLPRIVIKSLGSRVPRVKSAVRRLSGRPAKPDAKSFSVDQVPVSTPATRSPVATPPPIFPQPASNMGRSSKTNSAAADSPSQHATAAAAEHAEHVDAHARRIAQMDAPEIEATMPGNRLEDDGAAPAHTSPRREAWWHWKPTSANQAERLEKQMLAPIREQVQVEQRQVDVGEGVTINTLKMGSGPPLVMLHGMAAGVGFWAHNLPALAKKHTVYCIDMPGFGRSSRAEYRRKSSTTQIQDAEDYFLKPIERWAQAEGLTDSKFAILGHSFGGYLAGVYALRNPQHVRHLILADPWGIPERPANHTRNFSRTWKFVAMVATKFTPLAALRAAGPWGPDIIKKFRSDIPMKFRELYQDPRVVLDYIYHINANEPTGEEAFTALGADFGWARAPLFNRLTALDVDIPVTLLYGKETWMSRAAGRELRNALGERADFYTIEWAGHHIYADNYPQFNRILLNELSRWQKGVTAQSKFRVGKPETDYDSGLE